MMTGQMDRRLTIQRATSVVNAYNEPVATWATIATVWARRINVSDAERQRSAETTAEIIARFQIRFQSALASLNPKDRVICDGDTFDVWGVKELGRREGLEISATARADL
jgi:SPP1 family predicted phage head-tail adaptor